MNTKTPMEVAARLRGMLTALESQGPDRPSREKLASDLNGLLVDLTPMNAQAVRTADRPEIMVEAVVDTLNMVLGGVKAMVMKAAQGHRKMLLLKMTYVITDLGTVLLTLGEEDAADLLARANIKIALAARTSPPGFPEMAPEM